MGKDLSATEEDILPVFPSSCGRSPRPRFSSARGPPLSQLGCPITPPVLTPGRRGNCAAQLAAPRAVLRGELSVRQGSLLPTSPPFPGYSGSPHCHEASTPLPTSRNCLGAAPGRPL